MLMVKYNIMQMCTILTNLNFQFVKTGKLPWNVSHVLTNIRFELDHRGWLFVSPQRKISQRVRYELLGGYNEISVFLKTPRF